MDTSSTEADWQHAKYMPAIDDDLKCIIAVRFHQQSYKRLALLQQRPVQSSGEEWTLFISVYNFSSAPQYIQLTCLPVLMITLLFAKSINYITTWARCCFPKAVFSPVLAARAARRWQLTTQKKTPRHFSICRMMLE